MVCVEQSGFGDFFEEGRIFKDSVVKGYVRRGRGGGVGGGGGCVGWGNVGGQRGLDRACRSGGLWVALSTGISHRVYVDGPGVDELGVWVAGVQACGESEGDLDEGC